MTMNTIHKKIKHYKKILDNRKFSKEWKSTAIRIIHKGYDADKLQIILDDSMIDKIVKTSPSATYKHYQIGKVVQIRRNAAFDKSDLVLLRLPNGLLIPFSYCAFFTLDDNDNEIFENLYQELYKDSQELNHSQRWFTYIEDGNVRKYVGSIVYCEENKAKDLLKDASLITQRLQNKIYENYN